MIFIVCAVGLQWALCISGGLVIAKMRFRGRTLITAMFAISLFIPLVTTLIPTFVVTYKFGLINTYPGLILPIAAQTGFGTLLFRQYISPMPRGAVRRRPHRRRGLVGDPPPTRDTAREARDRGVSGHLCADRLEHVPVAACRREGGSLQVLTQTLAVVGTRARAGDAAERHLRVRGDRDLPMISCSSACSPPSSGAWPDRAWSDHASDHC